MKKIKNAKQKKSDNYNNNSSNENIFVNTAKKSNYKLQKIPIIPKSNLEKSNIAINNNINYEIKKNKNKKIKKKKNKIFQKMIILKIMKKYFQKI